MSSNDCEMKWVARTVTPAGEAGSRWVEQGERTETNREIESVADRVGGQGQTKLKERLTSGWPCLGTLLF